MNTKEPIPLSGRSPAEVPLSRAPLVRAIAQVRFPAILAINSAERVADFQEQIREIYPYLVHDRIQSVEIGPSGPSVTMETIWRFTDKASEPRWRVSLGVSFIAVEAYDYEGRSDFLVRLRKVLNGLKKSFKPTQVQRIGVRYVNRLVGEGCANASNLLQPQILGIRSGNDPLGAAVLQTVTESYLVAEEGLILARWGAMQPNATFDPDSMPPIAEQSYVIDLDISRTENLKYDVDMLVGIATGFSQRLYAVFRQMVTDDFLKFYGR